MDPRDSGNLLHTPLDLIRKTKKKKKKKQLGECTTGQILMDKKEFIKSIAC